MRRTFAAGLASGLLGMLTAGFSGLGCPPAAAQAPAADQLSQVVIQGRRSALPDSEVTLRIEAAIESSRFLYVPHVSIETRNGVVRLEGVLTDRWDLMQLLTLIRRAAGPRRIVNEIDLEPAADSGN